MACGHCRRPRKKNAKDVATFLKLCVALLRALTANPFREPFGRRCEKQPCRHRKWLVFKIQQQRFGNLDAYRPRGTYRSRCVRLFWKKSLLKSQNCYLRHVLAPEVGRKIHSGPLFRTESSLQSPLEHAPAPKGDPGRPQPPSPDTRGGAREPQKPKFPLRKRLLFHFARPADSGQPKDRKS